MEEIRLNKYLSDAGVCSRREADRLMEAGKIVVNGETASIGCKVKGRCEQLPAGYRSGRSKFVPCRD